MRIASWNVNSIRARQDSVLEWLRTHGIEVLCLQETKLTDEHFPQVEVEAAGYRAAYSGQKTYNGVALLARQMPEDVARDIPGLDDPARRILAATIGELRVLSRLPSEELAGRAKALSAPFELVRQVAELGRLPVPNFAAGGIATPADAALCMSLGAEAVFVGSGIFKSEDPERRARAIVAAVTHWREPDLLLEASRSLAGAMPGLDVASMPEAERLAVRGW